MSVRPLSLAAALALAAALSGCGKMGALERPGPLFGATRGEAPGAAAKQDPSRPVQTIDSRRRGGGDDATNPAPARSLPIEGKGPTATDVRPQGVLPDPYADPR